MRKNSIRKFIHAVLDVLPLLVIPIFALNILHKQIEPISIEVQESYTINYNQLIQVPTVDLSKTENGVEIIDNRDGTFNVKTDGPANANTTVLWGSISTIQNHVYVMRGAPEGGTNNYRVYVAGLLNTTFDYGTGVIGVQTGSGTNYPVYVNVLRGGNIPEYITFSLNVFDLTQMFGAGNEPTLEEFDNMFPLSYYEYSTGEERQMYYTITYDNTDIGSQFVYTLYTTVDNYFNMNNVFNMGAIWNWVNNTMFGGGAPLSAYIVYQIIAYELIMDIIFLLYTVMMFIVDFAESCTDRFLRKCGGH